METTLAGDCGPKPRDLVVHKRIWSEADAAVPVSAPPGHCIGAGGSMIMESDKRTGAARKQYIGIVTMLDILAHSGSGYEGDDEKDLDKKMAAPVMAAISHCIEGLSMWTLSPRTSVLEIMEVLSKGIHRVSVPLNGDGRDIHGAEVEESSHFYYLLTQTDVVKFRNQHSPEMESVTARSVRDLRAVNRQVFTITDAIRCMKVGLINVVPIVTTSHCTLLHRKGLQEPPLLAFRGGISAEGARGMHQRVVAGRGHGKGDREARLPRMGGGCRGGIAQRGGLTPSFVRCTRHDVLRVATHHWLPCVFGVFLLFFMGVEYTLAMVPPSSQPFDLGFVATRPLHRLLSSTPDVNTFLAFLNTVFVGMQTTYILWTWLIEGQPRATIATLFMFTCRSILGYSTQLPIPEEFLGSGVDFPVGNVSFFLFFSGHVASSVIASLDMRRVQRHELARLFDALNVLQVIRLLGTRGHYTIDLVAGIGAGILFDALAGSYEESNMAVKRVGFVNGITKHGVMT